MKITFYGAARSVTGSMYLLAANGHSVLLECGLFQGRRQESYERNRDLPFDARRVDAMVLSHAHLDHSGNIPSLVSGGFSGSIFCTAATFDLCSALLRDSAHIQESDAAYVNKKHAQGGQAPVQPLYTLSQAVASLGHFVSVNYHRQFQVVPGVQCTFYDAGHILGSAIVVLDIAESGRQLRLTFTGDLGRRLLPILRDPEAVSGTKVLITESTYGDRSHEAPATAKAALQRVVKDTFMRGGKVIIPAFAVGRTQELIYHLHQLMDDRGIPELPIFVDSPLAIDVTEVFRLHPECYDDETVDFALQHHTDPFGFSRLRYTRTTDESKQLNDLEGPAVIISASGMCEAGRILHHLKNNVGNPRNTILLVGFQAQDTLGRRIVERQPEIKIFGEMYPLRAQVQEITGYSAHADHDELLAYIGPLRGDTLTTALIVHGEETSALALAGDLTQMGIPQVIAPERLQEVEL